jgi:hypothetical protein
VPIPNSLVKANQSESRNYLLGAFGQMLEWAENFVSKARELENLMQVNSAGTHGDARTASRTRQVSSEAVGGAKGEEEVSDSEDENESHKLPPVFPKHGNGKGLAGLHAMAGFTDHQKDSILSSSGSESDDDPNEVESREVLLSGISGGIRNTSSRLPSSSSSSSSSPSSGRVRVVQNSTTNATAAKGGAHKSKPPVYPPNQSHSCAGKHVPTTGAHAGSSTSAQEKQNPSYLATLSQAAPRSSSKQTPQVLAKSVIEKFETSKAKSTSTSASDNSMDVTGVTNATSSFATIDHACMKSPFVNSTNHFAAMMFRKRKILDSDVVVISGTDETSSQKVSSGQAPFSEKRAKNGCPVENVMGGSVDAGNQGWLHKESLSDSGHGYGMYDMGIGQRAFPCNDFSTMTRCNSTISSAEMPQNDEQFPFKIGGVDTSSSHHYHTPQLPREYMDYTFDDVVQGSMNSDLISSLNLW